VRAVADIHALVWYLLDDPDRRLSSAALAALEEAESTDGIAVSVASVVDLWYVIRTRGTFTDDQLDRVVGLLRDPESPLEAEPIILDVAAAFRQIPRATLGDPWDRFITATAMALGLPLVTRNGASPSWGWRRRSGSSECASIGKHPRVGLRRGAVPSPGPPSVARGSFRWPRPDDDHRGGRLSGKRPGQERDVCGRVRHQGLEPRTR
jgi:PIN domain nuclease of toxin-antitoxin system